MFLLGLLDLVAELGHVAIGLGLRLIVAYHFDDALRVGIGNFRRFWRLLGLRANRQGDDGRNYEFQLHGRPLVSGGQESAPPVTTIIRRNDFVAKVAQAGCLHGRYVYYRSATASTSILKP